MFVLQGVESSFEYSFGRSRGRAEARVRHALRPKGAHCTNGSLKRRPQNDEDKRK